MKAKKIKNTYMVRIADKELAESLNKLIELSIYSSANTLINSILASGIGEFKKKYLTKKSKQIKIMDEENEILRRIKQIERNTDDMFVMLNIVETLVSTIYNTKVSELSGNILSGEMMESGAYSLLPEHMQMVKNEIIALVTKRNKGDSANE